MTDIIQIRTLEGWLYLAVVIDLYSRMVIGWSMKTTIHRDTALDALLMAVWRRKPKQLVIVHSDQGSQFGSDDWARFMKEYNLEANMSRLGNCYDNAVAESFFSSLKKEKTRRKSYRSRDELRADIFATSGSRLWNPLDESVHLFKERNGHNQNAKAPVYKPAF